MSFVPLAPASFRVLEIAGRDATGFLQSQLATDLRKLADGDCIGACSLAANGRVLASGGLLRRDGECWWWLLHEALAEQMAAHLRRFVLRSKLSLNSRKDLALCAAGTQPEELPQWRDPAGRILSLAPVGTAPEPDAHKFTMQALACGWLDFGLQHHDRFLAQMLGLQNFSAIALDKGCYPGQEIVARTHYLGRIKRAPRLLQLPAEPAVDSAVLDAEGQSVGEWLSVVSDDQRWLGMAVVETRVEQCWLQPAGPDPSPRPTSGLLMTAPR